MTLPKKHPKYGGKLTYYKDLEIGAEFYVTNGAWYGKIVEVDGIKKVHVVETGRTLDIDDTKYDWLNILESSKIKKDYEIVTLCGSTKFKDEFIEIQKELTLLGKIVISVGLFGHSGDNEVWEEGTKEMLDDMHKRKIDMADSVFVINKNGYIGESTESEIEYAVNQGKQVHYLEN